MIIFHDYEKIKTKNILIQSPQYISDKYSTKDISYLNNDEKDNFYIQTPYILINYLPISNEGKFTLDLPIKINKVKIDIISDNSLIIPEYIIDIKNRSKKTTELIEYYEKLKNLETQNKEDKFSEKKEKKKINKKKYNKKRYYKKTK